MSELISDNVTVDWAGTSGKVKGDIKTIQNWTDFDSNTDNNTGHFFPIELDEQYEGKKITVIGSKQKTAQDRYWVTRIENSKNGKFTFKDGSDVIADLDFSETYPVGEKAYDKTKVDFGGFGKAEDYVSNLEITWDGPNGKATGEIKNFTGTSTNGSVKSGHHFPLGLTEWYTDGIPKKVCGKAVKDKDIIISVESNKTPITVEYNGKTVINIDISGMTMGE